MIEYGKEMAHIREYEQALAFSGLDGPKWEDLTEEQRENIREANRQYWQEMKELGDSIKNAGS